MLALRLGIALAVMVGLMYLTWKQIPAAQADGRLTVEQAINLKLKILTWDRHYAMPIDFCIFPALVALIIFLCAGMWNTSGGLISAAISAVIIMLCLFVLWIGGNEAHVHDRWPTEAGFLHGVYAAIVVWALLMLLVYTPAPSPVLLLVICIAVPAFFFVGNHMFLGMINYAGAAEIYKEQPLKSPIGWATIIIVSGAVWWRSYMLIPTSFWGSIR